MSRLPLLNEFTDKLLMSGLSKINFVGGTHQILDATPFLTFDAGSVSPQ